jgi:hypothetical protein
MLQRAGGRTLSRMRAKVDHLCREREALRKSGASLSPKSPLWPKLRLFADS